MELTKKEILNHIDLMVVKDIKTRMKYATFMKQKFVKGTPNFEHWVGRREGLRKALISLQLTLKELK